jgi:CBS domain-containing protein
MRDREVHRIVIVDRNQRVSGVVSLGDIAKARGEKTVAGKTLKDSAKAA